VLLQQLIQRPLIRCQAAERVAQVPVDNRSHSFPRDSAVVGHKYARPTR
jgi:hypothetical protein